MKTIALIDTRSEVPGETLGILVSTHPDVNKRNHFVESLDGRGGLGNVVSCIAPRGWR
jgi:hypothetical protein